MSIKSILKEQKEIKTAEQEIFKRKQDWNSKVGLILLSQLLDSKWEVFSDHYIELKLKYTGEIPRETLELFYTKNAANHGYRLGELTGNIILDHSIFIRYTGIFTDKPHLAKFILELRKLGVKMSMKTIEKLQQSAKNEINELEEEIIKWRDAMDVF